MIYILTSISCISYYFNLKPLHTAIMCLALIFNFKKWNAKISIINVARYKPPVPMVMDDSQNSRGENTETKVLIAMTEASFSRLGALLATYIATDTVSSASDRLEKIL
mmetsp:Transcript_9418/g.19209  ORF Transcript_9418/g.19209 Transcript_9418/m.19209 type:complete len:108 (+) Transcript_9418:108-431(+)